MLSGEGYILPEVLSTQRGVDVNEIFQLTGDLSEIYHRRLFGSWLKQYQEAALDILLGPRWKPRDRGGITCPRCGGKSHKRRGFRARVVKTSRGKFPFLLSQVQCTRCGRTHRPFARALGVALRRVLPELEEKAVSMAVKLPYAPSSKLLKELIGETLSHEGIRNLIYRKAVEHKIKPPADVNHSLVDSTKVKAGYKSRGMDVHLAIAVERGSEKHGRATLKKKLLHLSVGDSDLLKTTLSKIRVKHLTHDGELNLKGYAQVTQRCLWHMGHQLKHYLWRDGLPLKERGSFKDKLYGILYDRHCTLKDASIAYDKLINELRLLGLKTSAGHLVRAKREIFNYKKNPMLCFSTTSPMEREIRELNRRTNVGARWSPKGIEYLLKILFLKRFKQYQTLSESMHPG